KNGALALALRLIGPKAVVGKAKEALFGRTFLAAAPPALAAWEERFLALPRRAAWRSVRAWISRPALLERIAAIRVPTLVDASEGEPGARATRLEAQSTSRASTSSSPSTFAHSLISSWRSSKLPPSSGRNFPQSMTIAKR